MAVVAAETGSNPCREKSDYHGMFLLKFISFGMVGFLFEVSWVDTNGLPNCDLLARASSKRLRDGPQKDGADVINKFQRSTTILL